MHTCSPRCHASPTHKAQHSNSGSCPTGAIATPVVPWTCRRLRLPAVGVESWCTRVMQAKKVGTRRLWLHCIAPHARTHLGTTVGRALASWQLHHAGQRIALLARARLRACMAHTLGRLLGSCAVRCTHAHTLAPLSVVRLRGGECAVQVCRAAGQRGQHAVSLRANEHVDGRELLGPAAFVFGACSWAQLLPPGWVLRAPGCPRPAAILVFGGLLVVARPHRAAAKSRRPPVLAGVTLPYALCTLRTRRRTALCEGVEGVLHKRCD